MSNFKKYFLLILIIVVALAIVGYLRAVPGAENQAGNYPQIEITPEFFDFGEIEYGPTVKHAFKVKNSGIESLEIRRVSTSCGCTTAEVGKENLASGEETDLLVEYNTGVMEGAHAKGDQERIIYIKSNDPKNPQIEVTIKAYVR